MRKLGRWTSLGAGATIAVAAVAVVVMVAAAFAGPQSHAQANPLKSAGTLVVGMNLQYNHRCTSTRRESPPATTSCC